MVNPNKMLTLDSGVKIPSGKYISANGSYAGYSEYIVYDPAQVRIRYVIQVFHLLINIFHTTLKNMFYFYLNLLDRIRSK